MKLLGKTYKCLKVTESSLVRLSAAPSRNALAGSWKVVDWKKANEIYVKAIA